MAKTIVRWASWDGAGLEHLVLDVTDDAVVAESVVIATDEAVFGAWYRLALDGGWRTREVEVRVLGDARCVRLYADGLGHWRDGDGAELPVLEGCIDVDITATPLTNTLPLRRLRLQVGETVELSMAYVSVPALTVTRDRQCYTRLDERRYRFEAPDSGFMREIEVGEDGLVVSYPGLFRRA